MQITTIGLDLAKSVCQIHAIDAGGQVAMKKKLRRAEVLKVFADLPPCLVGMEACATAHYWAREIGALGHQVRLMPPGRRLSAQTPGHRPHLSDPSGPHRSPGPRALGPGPARTQARPRRYRRYGQQDRPDCLGRAGPRRYLPAGSYGLIEIAAAQGRRYRL
jgi:hypothetical protein